MKYTIITINYNNQIGLRRTIDSVVGQTSTNYEYIVVDGGSTDGSVDIIKKHSDNIYYWVSENDRGIYHAMNKGVAQAHGDYCIFLNSGDSFYDKCVLERFDNVEMVDDIVIGKLISSNSCQTLFVPPTRELSMYYLYSATIPHQSSFIKTELLRLYPYDEKLKIVSDWKFFVQTIVLHNCSVRYVDITVAIFDLGGVSTTNPEKMWKEKEYVLSTMFPPRVLADYQFMKRSECLTQTLTPRFRQHFNIDKLMYRLGSILLHIVK